MFWEQANRIIVDLTPTFLNLISKIFPDNIN